MEDGGGKSARSLSRERNALLEEQFDKPRVAAPCGGRNRRGALRIPRVDVDAPHEPPLGVLAQRVLRRGLQTLVRREEHSDDVLVAALRRYREERVALIVARRRCHARLFSVVARLLRQRLELQDERVALAAAHERDELLRELSLRQEVM